MKKARGKRRRCQVSVLMTTLNSARFVSDAVKSILLQTLTDWELVVVDGGSIDETVGIVRRFKDKRIRLYVRKGLRRSAQLNFGIERAAGSYLAIMDSDDIALPSRLQTQIEYLKAHKDISLLTSWAYAMTEDGETVSTLRRRENHREILQSLLNQAEPLFPTAIWRKQVSERPNRFDETLRKNVELEWYVRISSAVRFAAIPVPLVRIRRTHGSASKKTDSENDSRLIGLIEKACSSKEETGVPSEEAALLYQWRGIGHYYYGSGEMSRKYLMRAWQLGGPKPEILRYLLPQLIFSRSWLGKLRRLQFLRRVANAFRGSLPR